MLRILLMTLLILTCLQGCDETNDGKVIIVDQQSCPTRLEIENMVNDKVELYVAEAIGSTINTAVSNTLTTVFSDVAEYNQGGSRLTHRKYRLSDGSIWYSFYDTQFKSDCNMQRLNDQYCCTPNINNAYVGEAQFNDVWKLFFYNVNSDFVSWIGELDKHGLPCQSDYSECVPNTNDEYVCHVQKIESNTYLADNCLNKNDINKWFVCTDGWMI